MTAFEDRARELANAAARDSGFSWEEEKREYLASLQALYGDIESWFNVLAQSNVLTFRREDVELHEDGIGAYKAPSLIMQIGRKDVRFVPAGTLFIGTKGIVEVVSGRGRLPAATLKLKLDDNQRWKWTLAERETRAVDKQVLEKILEQLIC